MLVLRCDMCRTREVHGGERDPGWAWLTLDDGRVLNVCPEEACRQRARRGMEAGKASLTGGRLQ